MTTISDVAVMVPFFFDWYLKAAYLGQADSMNKLAACYQNGIRVEKDVEKAFEW